MHDQDRFDEHVRATLARYGAEADAIEMEVIRAAEAMYGPLRDALLAADLSGVEPEPWIDPATPPAPPAGGNGAPL